MGLWDLTHMFVMNKGGAVGSKEIRFCIKVCLQEIERKKTGV